MNATLKQKAVRGIVLVILAVAIAVLLLGVVDSAAGQDSELANSTVNVTSETTEVQAVAENPNGTLNVTVYGIDDSGNETQVATGNITSDNLVYSYTEIDAENYTQYRVVVTGDGADSIDVKAIEETSDAGGGILSSAPSVPGGVWGVIGSLLVVIAVGLAITRASGGEWRGY